MDGHPDRQVVLVRGPAGAGKTVLVAQWVRARDQGCVWLSIDATHNDPDRLLRDLVDVTGQLSAGAGGPDVGRCTGPGGSGRVELGQALRAATQRVAGKATVVVDDVHRLHRRSARHVLSHLVEHPPEDVRVVLISRSKPRLGLERARLRGDRVEIGPADLRFQRAEVETLASTWTGRHVDPTEVEQATLGWAAGLRLEQLEALPGGTSLPALQDHDGVVGEYVSEELIESASAALRSFLDVTCWLPMVTEPLYAAVTGDALNPARMARAELEALPIVAVASCPGAFRYPPIFSRVLQQRLSRRRPRETTRVRRRAAEACREAGELMTSMRLFLEAGCADEAADVCSAVAAGNESALRAVDALVQELPDSMLDGARWLPWRVRAAVAAGRIDQACRLLQYVDSASPSAVIPGQTDGEDLLVARAVVAEHLGDVTALLACADRVLASVERRSATAGGRSRRDRSDVGQAYGWQVRALVWSGDTDHAREVLRDLRQAGDRSLADRSVEVTTARAWLAWVDGDVARLAELAAVAREESGSRAIYRKLGVPHRSEAVRRAKALQLV